MSKFNGPNLSPEDIADFQAELPTSLSVRSGRNTAVLLIVCKKCYNCFYLPWDVAIDQPECPRCRDQKLNTGVRPGICSDLTLSQPQSYESETKHPIVPRLDFTKMARFGPKSYVTMTAVDLESNSGSTISGEIIGYCRCSGPNHSMANQTSFITQYAQSQGNPVEVIGYDYNISGREGFGIQRALNVLLWFIQPGDILVTTYRDRLTRDSNLFDNIVAYLTTKGASCKSLMD